MEFKRTSKNEYENINLNNSNNLNDFSANNLIRDISFQEIINDINLIKYSIDIDNSSFNFEKLKEIISNLRRFISKNIKDNFEIFIKNNIDNFIFEILERFQNQNVLGDILTYIIVSILIIVRKKFCGA